MKNRLIELLLQSDPIKERDLDDELYDGEIEDIADHLIANGVIVPPCKVGDTVYFSCLDENCEKFIDKGRVYAISQNENTLWFSVRYLSGLRYDHTSSDFGKTVFLTREAADQALKEATAK